MMATRLRQFGLLLFSMLICGVAFFQMFERTTGGFPHNYLWMLAFIGALFLTSWGLLLRFQPYANQAIMCYVMVLTGTGVMMIARIDQDLNTSVAFKQLLWLSIALVLANLLVIFMKDYRVLRRVSYVSLGIGLGPARRFRTVWRPYLGEDSWFGIVPAKRIREAVPRILLRLLSI